LEFVEADLPLIVDRRHPQQRVAFLAQPLPGDQVRMVLQAGDQDLVAGADVLPSPGLGHEVDRFGGAAREDDLRRVWGVEEAGHVRPRSAVSGGLRRGARVSRARSRWAVASCERVWTPRSTLAYQPS